MATSAGPGESVRLAELLGALSVATDLAAGQPLESAWSASVVAVRLGRRLGLGEDALADLYYAALVRFLGCTATAAEAGALGLGEDLELNFAMSVSDWQSPASVEAALRRHFAPHVPNETRDAAIRGLLEALPAIPSLASLHCMQALVLARRLGVPAGALAILEHLNARWDGRYPGPAASEIHLGERIVAVAVGAELMRRAAGAATAVELVSMRAATTYDPEVCRCLVRDARELFADLDGATRWTRFLDAEPGAPRQVAPRELGAVAMAFADFADHKSPWHLGHSRQVARLAFLAGEALGLAADERETLRVAALLHDIGRAGVPNAVWDKTSALTPIERAKCESHSASTEQVLGLAPSLARVRDLAAATHERADGGGYHRRVPLGGRAAGLLAAADVFDALTHERPWRPPHELGRAIALMTELCDTGKLPREATRAVLEAAGAGKRAAERAYPAGLTEREVEVIRLIARGLTTRSIGEQLGISAKTADHHIQHAYDKCGVRGRAAIAVFAIEHGIVEE